MIVYSKNIGRLVPLRDLPLGELVDLMEAVRLFRPTDPFEAQAQQGQVDDLWVEAQRRGYEPPEMPPFTSSYARPR